MLFTTTTATTASAATARTHAQKSLEIGACLHKTTILHKKELKAQGVKQNFFE